MSNFLSLTFRWDVKIRILYIFVESSLKGLALKRLYVLPVSYWPLKQVVLLFRRLVAMDLQVLLECNIITKEKRCPYILET